MWYTLLVVGFLAVCHGQRDAVLEEWTLDNYPDPAVDPEACGRYAGRSAYVCDPNSLLPAKGADVLDTILDRIYKNETKCPCSAFECEKVKTGTYMSVALVKKLKLPQGQEATEENKVNAAEKFAFGLSRKAFKDCDNDVVIIFSGDDETLYTVAGTTSARVLTSEVIRAITQDHLHHFEGKKDLTAGLYSLILDYRNVMRGTYQSQRSLDKSQVPRNGVDHHIAPLASFITVAVAAIITCWY